MAGIAGIGGDCDRVMDSATRLANDSHTILQPIYSSFGRANLLSENDAILRPASTLF